MSFTGVIVNTGTVLAGSLLGLLFKKGIPEKVNRAVMIALGLFTLYIGMDGALGAQNALIVVASLVLGAIVGTLLDIDGAINRLGLWAERKFNRGEGEKVSLAEGFMTASLLFCVGAMTVNGAIEAGVQGKNTLFYTKALMDLCSSMMLAAGLGLGVMLSAAFVLVFQGLLVLLAGWIAPALTPEAIAEMTAAGSLIMVGLGLNLLGVTKIKVADYLPAIVFAPVICWIVSLF
ncbi:MAG: DUF554 domain-containing protein [Oscillospiraceae bacterium]|nr:DUF554 domain-containing protein [Oscillospiraceae bacterium]